MKLEKINTETLRQKVYDQLRHRIVSGQILPGESISLRALAEGFGVSMMPVREAIWQLESEKVIVIQNNRSIRVSKLTIEEMKEALEMRLVLESLAAEKSCERRPDTALPEVKALLEGVGASITKPRRYLMKNTEFHFAIYSYAESPLLLEFIDRLWTRVGPYIIHAASSGDLSRSMDCHRQMFEGFAKRDKHKLINGLRADLKSAVEFIIPFLENPTDQTQIRQ